MRKLLAFTALTLALASPAAHAAFPGQNGKIAFVGHQAGNPQQSDIYVVNPDGTGLVQLTNDAAVDWEPAWSGDGMRLAWRTNRDGNYEVYVMNADGSAQTRLTSDPAIDGRPTWSPDRTKLAFHRSAASEQSDIWVMNSDGSNPVNLTANAGFEQFWDPSWSPDGTRLAFARQLGVMDVDGSNVTHLPTQGPCVTFSCHERAPDWSPDGTRLVYHWLDHDDLENPLEQIRVHRMDESGEYALDEEVGGFSPPSWSPDGSKIAYMDTADEQLFVANADGGGSNAVPLGSVRPSAGIPNPGGVSWQPIPDDTSDLARRYVRPRGATPLTVALVPAYSPCTSPNRQHGPPLAFGSCHPPQPVSSRLTNGTGDGSPALARGSGALRMDVAGSPGPPDDSDFRLTFRLLNVMHANDRSEYAGEVRAKFMARRVDREFRPDGEPVTQTSMDFSFGFTVPCSPTPDSSLDASKCISFTSVNAIVPGAITEAKRTMWALERIGVYDGGPDEDADTDADNSLFMTQGVFVP